MINQIYNFFTMGGYGFFVWSAYTSVFACLFLQWLLPWRRWRHYFKTIQQQEKNDLVLTHNEQNS